MRERFDDRPAAGRALAAELTEYADGAATIVLALPRGGVPVGAEVARALGVPLAVCPVRKLGVPGREELAFGAVATGGLCVFNEPVIRSLGLSRGAIEEVIAREQKELRRRERLYCPGRERPELRDRTVLVVDDGLATGATMRAALAAVQGSAPERVVVAVPVGARATCARIARRPGVRCVCLLKPDPFVGVGAWYRDFAQTSDEEVRRLLGAAEQPSARTTRTGPAGRRPGGGAHMERIRSYYDADRVEAKDLPTAFKTGHNKNELYCSMCGENYFVNDSIYRDVMRAIERTTENPFLCPDCIESYEEAAHR